MARPVVLVPRGDNLEAVTPETRAAVAHQILSLGFVLQVWTWRNGEAVVLRRPPTSYNPRGEPVVVMRRGLRAGRPTVIWAESIASALHSVGLAYRNRVRRSPAWRSPPSWRAQQRRPLLASVHARGNRWRTLRVGTSPSPVDFPCVSRAG